MSNGERFFTDSKGSIPIEKMEKVIRGDVSDVLDRFIKMYKVASDNSPYGSLSVVFGNAEKDVTIKRMELLAPLVERIYDKRDEREETYRRMQRIRKIFGFLKGEQQEENAYDLAAEKFDKDLLMLEAINRGIFGEVDQLSGISREILKSMVDMSKRNQIGS